MRFFIFFTLIIINVNTGRAQAPKTSSKTPSRSQVQSQMNEVVNELNKQVTETEKQLADAIKNKEEESVINDLKEQLAMLKKQITMMGGLNKNISKVSDKVVQAAADEENSDGIPKKDNERINALPKKPLNDAELTVFVQKVFTAIDTKLPASQKKNAKEFYDEINLKAKLPDATGMVAAQCWLAGSTDMAIWMLGKACLDDMTNTDNLSNYASLLSMVGGEHLAIPILQNLERKFPGNTTILNNLGQAWFGLGEMNNAKKNLDNTMMGYGMHSPANATMCIVQQSEGKTAESIESLKRSIREEYTPEKEARLTNLGGKLEYDDLPFRYPAKAEPLGIEKFMNMIPPYPFEAGEASAKAQMEWDDFKRQVWEAKTRFDEEGSVIKQKATAYSNLLLSNPQILKPYNNTVYLTSARKLKLLYDWYTDRFIALNKKKEAAADTIKIWKAELRKAIDALGYDPQNPNKNCGKIQSLATNFLLKANALWQQRNAEMLSLEKQKLNAEATFALYGTTDRSLYEVTIVNIKIGFMIFLGNLPCEFEYGCMTTEDEKPKGKLLPDFDEMNCQYKTELSIPYFEKTFSIKVECNKMITNFNAKYVKGSLEENLANGKYKGNLEIEAKAGSDKQKFGPIELGTSVKAGAGVEFTEGGIQDVYVSGKVDVKAGVAEDMGLTVSPSPTLGSVEAKISFVTGQGSVTGKGALSGISIK